MNKQTEELVKKLAGLIMVDCGYGGEYPCPHNIPLDDCPHEDADICMWQLEQAAQILRACKESGLVFEVRNSSRLPPNNFEVGWITYEDIEL